MNKANYVFSKEGSLVEVPYVEPTFWKVLVSSQWFQGIMACEGIIWSMWYDMCNIIYGVCKMIYMMIHVTLIAWLS